MEPMEVIDLSSDDEKSPPKNRDAACDVPRKKEAESDEKNIDIADVEIVYNTVNTKKRCASENENKNHLKIKKPKFSKEDKQSEIVSNLLNKKSEITLHKITKVKPQTLSTQCTPKLFECDNSDKTEDNNMTSSTRINGNDDKLLTSNVDSGEGIKSPNSSKKNDSFKINEGASSSSLFVKPELIVKNKIKVSECMDTNLGPSTEVFESFLDTCKGRDSSKDMAKIIEKLKKRYNNLQPSYAKSGLFIELVRKKRNLIANDRTKLYLHISEVMAEMKARLIQNRSSVEGLSKQNTTEPRTPAKSGLSETAEDELNQNESTIVDLKTVEQLKALEKAMRRCQRRINRCEMAEVDFDDENDSHYILAEKYKCRMVQLYNKYCEITGESPDAARPYLRPKDFSVTMLPSLNHAITSFINTKITNMKKSLVHTKKNAGQLRFTDALIFPDYVDILNCVEKCNKEQNLKLSKSTQESMAKTAFSELGRYLKRCRQSDYYDTFSLYLEKEDCDPATTDQSLAEKLERNQELGKKNMDQVFQDFVEKQNAVKASENGACEKEEEVKTDDESMGDTEDQETSEDEENGIELHSDSRESETDELNAEAKDDLNHKGNKDVELDEPQHDLNSKDNHIIEVDKPQDDSNEKGDPVVQPDKLPDCQNQKSNKDVELDKTQGDLNQQRTMNVESDTDTYANNKITQNKTSLDGPNSISVKATDNKSMEIVISESTEDRIVGNIELKKKNDKECLAEAQAIPLQTENNCITLDEINIDEKLEKIVDPSDSKKIASVPSQIQKLSPTVSRYKVNLMQAPKTLEMNLIDGCSPAIPATKVIDAPAVAGTVKLISKEVEKKPTLRLRQFAKPPGSWKDFQSPTKSPNENSRGDGTADANKETIKMNKTPPAIEQASKLVKLSSPIPVGKTIQVKNRVLMNLKNKKSTVMIPTSLNTSQPKINVQSVTNNVTVNFNNQVKSPPKITSVVSHALKPGQNIIKIDEGTKIITFRNNPGVIRIGPNNDKTSKSPNPIQTVNNSNRQALPIKKPAPQVRLVSHQTTGSSGQQQYQVISPKSAMNGDGKVVRRIPIIVDRGKNAIVQLVNRSPGGKSQNFIVPAEATVSQNQTCMPNQRPNSTASTVASPNSKLKVPNINTQTVPLKVPQLKCNKVRKVYGKTTDNVPTYLIE